MNNKKIFVQIAAYRDPDLNATLDSLYKNAFFPENLRVVVANQYADGDEPVAEHPGLEVLNIPYKQVVSACWVRNLIQQEYKDEDYTLQLDSHMRFVFGWDVLLYDWYNQLKEKGYNPLITGYVPGFDPLDDPKARGVVPWVMQFDFFTVDGWISFMPTHLDDYMAHNLPVPARFYSAHFAFADGAFSKNVQHDPNYYFHGEEISIGVRAYTHGYDLFQPHRLVAWHEYTRKLRIGNYRLQWDNDPSKGRKEAETFRRNRILFGMEEGQIDFGKYGFGTKRTLAEFERYAGVKFATRQVHPDAINRLPPGQNTQTQEEWESELVTHFKHTINIYKDSFPLNDYAYFVVAYHDADGNTIFRKDLTESEVTAQLANARSQKLPSDQFIRITREFYPATKPAYWVVWPYSKSQGYVNRVSENLP